LALGTDKAGDVLKMRRERVDRSFAVDEPNIVLAAEGWV
jgi:hypothetical protein